MQMIQMIHRTWYTHIYTHANQQMVRILREIMCTLYWAVVRLCMWVRAGVRASCSQVCRKVLLFSFCRYALCAADRATYYYKLAPRHKHTQTFRVYKVDVPGCATGQRYHGWERVYQPDTQSDVCDTITRHGPSIIAQQQLLCFKKLGLRVFIHAFIDTL